jgi:seryl-tRNA(Sec) selenium transferase
VTLAVGDHAPSALLERLRSLDPPVIARIVNDTVVLDLRTVLPDDEDALERALLSL